MAKILVVDDNALNRQLLTALLELEGHAVFEAIDGADGLATARAEQPQLIISDILMPSMDGYEFVRRLRVDPRLGKTAVIFYTAHYHEREARKLAETCGVARVLVKPCPNHEILGAVAASLSRTADLATPRVDEGFDRDHLHLVTNKLSQKTAELLATNARLEALTELNVQLASERDPRALLEKVCHGARYLLGAKYAVLAVAEEAEPESLIFSTSGIDFAGRPAERPQIDAGLFGQVFTEARAVRVATTRDGEPIVTGLPAGYPALHSILAVPVASLTRIYGWLCLSDKSGSDGFDGEDERILSILGAQVGRIYENGSLYRAVQEHVAQLSVEMEERNLAATKIQQLNRVYAVLSAINSLIVRVYDRDELLREACRLSVEQGRFRLAWCGWLGGGEQISIAASAGENSVLPQPGRDSVDYSTANNTLLVAALHTRQPQVCNDIEADGGRVMYRDEMLEQGFCAVAVLPLVVAGRAVGCLVLVTDVRGFFDETELRLLTELAGDISFALDHIQKSERLNYLAYYDVVTGLSNRTLFHERLALQVATAARDGRRLALVVADLERFEAVNDAFGRASGDELLRQVAERFSRSVGDPTAVARIGPDRFAAILFQVDNELNIARSIEQWHHQWFDAPFLVQGNELTIAARAGTSVFPEDGHDAVTLLKNAEAAVKTAKSTGERHLVYTHVLSERIAERLALENKMRGALQREEFTLYYQPKIDLNTRRLEGVEALIRWRSPELGLLPPSQFIPLMEENGMIVEVGAWVLRQAALDRSRWIGDGVTAPRVAVNVSTIQLRDADFVRTVTDVLQLTDDAAGIDIEVTESVIMGNVADNIEKLAAIRKLGVGIALDDFGTGYSSLGYLAKLPVDTLKIDRSFVAAMEEDSGAMTLVSTIISLAHALNLNTIAEGVESEKQARLLCQLRCDQMQGFLICKPLAFDETTAFLRTSPG